MIVDAPNNCGYERKTLGFNWGSQSLVHNLEWVWVIDRATSLITQPPGNQASSERSALMKILR
jgi:hypothetical protein